MKHIMRGRCGRPMVAVLNFFAMVFRRFAMLMVMATTLAAVWTTM